MLNRRDFLAHSSALAATGGVPQLWQRAAAAAEPGADSPILVVVELTGGNDGLNMVIPFKDDAYHRARPTLRIEPKKVLTLDDRLGMHPAMTGLHKLWANGKVRVVMNVGYPNPSRSHSRSMEIWQSGKIDPTPTMGWLGRLADNLVDTAPACFIGGGATPLAIEGRSIAPFALDDLEGMTLRKGAGLFPAQGDGSASDPVARVSRAMAAARVISEKVAAIRPDDASAGRESLEAKLATVCRLIDSGVGSRVYYTSLDGFDTHASQQYAHRDLLRQLSEAVSRFQLDLESRKLDKRVVTLVFSEFGRRLEENGSKGTDHGAAGPVLLVGSSIAGGVLGGAPDLVNLEAGDIRFKVDFRDLYASVLVNWLRVNPVPVIGRGADGRIELFHS